MRIQDIETADLKHQYFEIPKAERKIKGRFGAIKRKTLDILLLLVYNYYGDLKMKEREYTITKANEKIQKSRYSLSTQQQKIILYLISQINPKATEFKKGKFKIQEFCKVCGIDYESGKNYTTLKEQIKKIADRSCWVRLEDGRETLLRWIEKPYIDEKSGTIEIIFDKDMKPFLLELRQNFTQFELSYALLFKSKYSIRLFELLESYHYHKLEPLEKKFNIEELKKILDCENYKAFKDFRKNVIELAIKEINENTMYNLKYDLIKEVRSYTEIIFYLDKKEVIQQMETHQQNNRKFNKEV